MEWEKSTKCTTWNKKLDRNVRQGVSNNNEMNDLEEEIRSKYMTWSKKLDRNVRHGVRNMNEMNDMV